MSTSAAIRSISYATAAQQRRRFRVIVIGAGQAGLAVARQLVAADVDVIVLEREGRIGESWRRRWDSLRLFTAAELIGLPGLPFPGDKNAFPTKDEMAAYLERYAREMHVPVRVNTKVDSLERTARGYVVAAGDRRFEADHVVVTTGPYQRPRTPGWAGDLHRSIVQIQSSDYRNPAQLPDGDVLVVGAGNTGAELALEAAGAGHRVFLSGREVAQVPRVLRLSNGRIFWFLATHVFTTGSPIGRRIAASFRAGHSGPIVRIRKEDLAKADIVRVARVAGACNGRPQLEDGRLLDVTTVLWCTGFTMDFSWIHLPVFTPDGYPMHERGRVPAAPGLYFVGLPLQRSLSSSTLVGVGRDATLVADWISKS
jgi:putative flavoprotein involved in K+ transport